MRKLLVVVLLFIFSLAKAQPPETSKEESWEKNYHAAVTKINDLVHTKLEVKFDYTKSFPLITVK